MDPRCAEISHPGYANFSLSLLILVGILISYLPQHLRIIRLRSSYGLSPYFVLLGTTSGTCAFANILVLPKSRLDVSCCRQVDDFACVAGLLGIAQVGVQWSCFTIILLLFLIFFPRNPSSTTEATKPLATPSANGDNLENTIDPTIPSADPSKETHSLSPSYRLALIVTLISILHVILTAILSFYFIYARPWHAQSWANFLGILSTILASIQYFPQIYTTWKLKRVGSLSIPMMCIQTPGSFVWAGSLAARLGKEGWSAWGVYLVTGCLQGILLTMGIYFEVLLRRREKKELMGRIGYGNTSGAVVGNDGIEPEPENEGERQDASEETPLLRAEG